MPEFIDSHLVDRSGTKVLPFIIVQPFKSLQQKRHTRAHTQTHVKAKQKADSCDYVALHPLHYTRVLLVQGVLCWACPVLGDKISVVMVTLGFKCTHFASEKIIRFVIASTIYIDFCCGGYGRERRSIGSLFI